MFEKLKDLEVKAENTASFTIYEIEGEPTLHLSPATEANKPYFNALLKKSRKNQQRIKSNTFTAKMLEETRDIDAGLFPKHIIRGWDDMVDNGKPVPPTVENFHAFVQMLPDWLFDNIRTFASESANFVKSEIDIVESAGNSQ